MEFQGRIKKLLPVRSGVSQRTGNEWKSLPFVFEYFEHETDRYADSVLLETFDTKVIDGLKEGMDVRCGFSHHTREYEGKTYNELRLYKIEIIRKSAANQPTQTSNAADAGNNTTQQANAAPETPSSPKVDANSNITQKGGDDDGLPF